MSDEGPYFDEAAVRQFTRRMIRTWVGDDVAPPDDFEDVIVVCYRSIFETAKKLKSAGAI